MLALPTIRQLQFFNALVRRRSFSKAAEDCFVSQSTLSSGVKELETLLGQQLVDRSTRSFSLTPAGEEVASRSLKLLAIAEDIARSAGARQPLEGHFRLGVIPTIAPFLLPVATPILRERYPELELYLREDLTAKLADQLASGQLDAVILALPYDLPGIEAIDVADDAFVVAAAPGHTLLNDRVVPFDALNDVRLLLLEDGHCLRDHALAACKLQDPRSAAAFGATSLFTLAQMVQAGLGATLLPQMAVNAGFAAASGLETRPLEPPTPSRRIGVAWRKGSGRAEEAGLIGEVVREALLGVAGQ
ncbi:MAG: LysR family transcriptional regulator [Alphaproteobacteria bacterium]|nr:LysR family transcriptional regulator [Alphaproteobacteria bacterium]